MPSSHVLEKSFRVLILWLYLRDKDHVGQGDEVLKVPANLLHLHGHLDRVLQGEVVEHQQQVLPVPPLQVDPAEIFRMQFPQIFQGQLWQTFILTVSLSSSQILNVQCVQRWYGCEALDEVGEVRYW